MQESSGHTIPRPQQRPHFIHKTEESEEDDGYAAQEYRPDKCHKPTQSIGFFDKLFGGEELSTTLFFIFMGMAVGLALAFIWLPSSSELVPLAE